MRQVLVAVEQTEHLAATSCIAGINVMFPLLMVHRSADAKG